MIHVHIGIPDGHSATAKVNFIEITLSSQITDVVKLYLYDGGQTKQTRISAKIRIIYAV